MTIAIITSGTAMFDAEDVGRELRKRHNADGTGGGRARILEVLSTTEVLCKVLVDFDTTEQADSDQWYFTSDKITGLSHLEGETVTVQADGGAHLPVTIVNGTAKLTQQVGTAYVGYGYRSTIESLNLDVGGQTGSAQAKPRNVFRAVIDFLNTLGCKFGTTPYNLERLLFRSAADKNDRPPPLLTGNKDLPFYDGYDNLEKKVFIVQDSPLPCTIRAIDVYVDAIDED